MINKFNVKNITELFKILIEEKLRIAAFPIHEYWIDIGTPEDLDKARDIFKNNFLLQ
jgi:NDP-sugar pyrophosphorylase family protein